MPTLKRFDRCRVVMYVDDHPPPHVHVKMSDGRDSTVDIGTLLMKGVIQEREIRDALAWIAANTEFLLAEWRRYHG